MNRYRVLKVQKSGWAPWTMPDMKNFQLACCNCGSTHNVQFRVKEVVKRHKDGTLEVRDARGDFVVEFRMAINFEETYQIRQDMIKNHQWPEFPSGSFVGEIR